jgi:hypothetical protein
MQLDTTLLATDKYDLESLTNKETFFDKYLFEEYGGHISLESAFLNSSDNVKSLVKFLFKSIDPLVEIYKNNSSTIFDLTKLKSNIASFEELENFYPRWLVETGRQNTMDEYGMLIGFVGYAQRNANKKYFLLMVDQE